MAPVGSRKAQTAAAACAAAQGDTRPGGALLGHAGREPGGHSGAGTPTCRVMMSCRQKGSSVSRSRKFLALMFSCSTAYNQEEGRGHGAPRAPQLRDHPGGGKGKGGDQSGRRKPTPALPGQGLELGSLQGLCGPAGPGNEDPLSRQSCLAQAWRLQAGRHPWVP